jgi:hypothetical protein
MQLGWHIVKARRHISATAPVERGRNGRRGVPIAYRDEYG